MASFNKKNFTPPFTMHDDPAQIQRRMMFLHQASEKSVCNQQRGRQTALRTNGQTYTVQLPYHALQNLYERQFDRYLELSFFFHIATVVFVCQ